jgi:transposase
MGWRVVLARGGSRCWCARPGAPIVPRLTGVKTDMRDAIRLARRLAAGELSFVTVPSVEHEQVRDLVRCRDDIRAELMRPASAG